MLARSAPGLSRYLSNLTVWLLGVDHEILHENDPHRPWPSSASGADFRIDAAAIAANNEAATQRQHTCFALDVSYSMSSDDARPRGAGFTSDRLGAACEAVYEFLQTRLQLQSDVEEVFTIVEFNHSTRVIYHNTLLTQQSLREVRQYLQRVTPRGGTIFCQAADAIASYMTDALSPDRVSNTTLLFLTDGEAAFVPQGHIMFTQLRTRKDGGQHAETQHCLFGVVQQLQQAGFSRVFLCGVCSV